jgi:hypothetical protein
MLKQHYQLTCYICVMIYILNLSDDVTSEHLLSCDAIELATAKHEGA